ncbi:MAG: isoleucine--tRNA ligase [Planctomycetaceae bacterium]|nr:isoleucine--tRNA ligase [Planctomycetaceae bacterium]
MFSKVSTDAEFVRGEHDVLRFWREHRIFDRLREQNREKPRWSFIDGPITANNPMGVHHAWGRTYKDAYQRYFAMTGRALRYQNGFDCQGLWVEVEVEKQLGLGTKNSIVAHGMERFVDACKQRVLTFAARQTEQSQRLGFWMDWDDPATLRKLAAGIGTSEPVTITTPTGKTATARADELVARLGNPEWGGSYFTFSTENNETIWTFLKKCHQRGKIYRGHDVMPWSGRGGSAYSQMEVAEGRKLTTHKSVFVRFPLKGRDNEFLLVWTTTPWTLTSNVAAAVNPLLEYVRLRAKRDGAVYYFAKENLEFQRLAKEFKEGFGRPEWDWPKGVGKLKSIAQIFKEQGGFDVEGTLNGAQMLGWEYSGPFDDLAAQEAPGGVPANLALVAQTGVSCHRVVDGGRDHEGTPLVLAGEGTGIVHIAPGCGDVDHVLGKTLGLVAIAPLGEDGRFVEGFGPFVGKEAVDRQTAELVFEELRKKNLLVAVEEYPHIYPHCWRTGDELVFRLVDEWFINMDWRDEIKEVVREIEWLPASIDGQTREIEWLSNMRDWMISKKRFWGLALPIWVDEDESVRWDDPAKFEVIGSLAELKERAVSGWDEFAGHTPHRPWIDKVKIRSPRTGNLMTRIPDVGNPWLDAGIVPFSTMQYNTNRDQWRKWYPADLVTECFPGQFRNWFYSLLSLGTMMMWDEQDPPEPGKRRPFKTLLGHRLVMNEDGKPMHKSDGTAIWFEEAAEQLGVDTMRWMYLAHNPAVDLRFGRREKDKPVTLQTPEGPITETVEGFPTCLVTSKPADEIRRQVLIPLWNTYAFFVNYARLDEFDPQSQPVPVVERPEIDRWILSNLQGLIEVANTELQAFNAPGFLREAARFIDDLSNWYVRRNRRRFWRSRDADDRDKLAAYQTLYTVLVTLTKLLAPAIPFITERMYQNLCAPTALSPPLSMTALSPPLRKGGQGGAGEPVSTPESQRHATPPNPPFLRGGNAGAQGGNGELSVHLCEFPVVDPALRDPQLSERMALAQLVVNLGHGLREEAKLRVRQPLPELRFACANSQSHAAIEKLADVIQEELNVKKITGRDNLDDLVHYNFKPNLKTLGPKFGKGLSAIGKALSTIDENTLAPLRRGESVTLSLDGTEYQLAPDDVLISTQQAADWVAADDQGVQIALSTVLTPELLREGMARDFVRQVQQLRKAADLEIQNRIRVFLATDHAEVMAAIAEWDAYIRSETLADTITGVATAPPEVKPALIGETPIPIWIEKA